MGRVVSSHGSGNLGASRHEIGRGRSQRGCRWQGVVVEKNTWLTNHQIVCCIYRTDQLIVWSSRGLVGLTYWDEVLSGNREDLFDVIE